MAFRSRADIGKSMGAESPADDNSKTRLHGTLRPVRTNPKASQTSSTWRYRTSASYAQSPVPLSPTHNQHQNHSSPVVESTPITPLLLIDKNDQTKAPDLIIKNMTNYEELPTSIGKLTHLVSLSLENNGFDSIPIEIGHLTGLKCLNLRSNNLKSLPKNLGGLVKLKQLFCDKNAIEELPAGIFDLPELAQLVLSSNSLWELPETLINLTSLKRLEIARNPIMSFGPSQVIWRMKNLTHLDLSGSKIPEIPPQVSNMISLQVLLLDNNNMFFLPAEIGQLVELKVLSLANNSLQAIPMEIGKLHKLSSLVLDNNNLEWLPTQLSQILLLTHLKVKGNPLSTIPDDILRKGSKDILTFLRDLHKIKAGWNRLKVVVVGQEAVGKTTLLRALTFNSSVSRQRLFTSRHKALNSEASETLPAQTIESAEWKIRVRLPKRQGERLKLLSNVDNMYTDLISETTSPLTSLAQPISSQPNLNSLHSSYEGLNSTPVINEDERVLSFMGWDFAGQEIYHSTHQFFLSRKSLYLLTFNLVDEGSAKLENWLNTIQARGNGPVLLVGTHLDDKRCTPAYVSSMIQRIHEKFKRRFVNLKGVVALSCASGKGMDDLREWLCTIALEEEQQVPASYRVLARIADLERSNRQIIEWSIFEKWCQSLGVPFVEMNAAAAFLNDVGVLIFFPTDPSLKDILVLDPQYLARIMATIITLKNQFVKDGILEAKYLPYIWPKFKKEHYALLVALLQKFEVCYKLSLTEETNASKNNSNNNPTLVRPPPPVGELVGTGPGPVPVPVPEVVEDQQPQQAPLPWEDNADCLLIPCLLPQNQPQSVADTWPPDFAASGAYNQLGRIYQFGFLPHGFFSRLMIRTLHRGLVRPLTFWSSGMVVELDTTRAMLRFNPVVYELSVTVRESHKGHREAAALLRLLIENIDALVSGWYDVKPNIFIPCCHCLTTKETSYDPFRFGMDDCATAVRQGVGFVLCRGIKPIRIDFLAPDLSFCDFGGRRVDFQELELIEVLGKGAFATVWSALLDKNMDVAVKVLNDRPDDPEENNNSFNEFQREVFIMSFLVHPNLVKLIAISLKPLSMIMECLKLGTLYHALPNESIVWTNKLSLKIALDIAKGMEYLHSVIPPIIHRDLRSPNVLLATTDEDQPIIAKVADFGLARLLFPTMAGGDFNPNWLAPEIMRGEEYNTAVDVYSFGVIVWELLTREKPFGEYDKVWRNHFEFKNQILKGLRPTIPEQARASNPAICQMIVKCWDDNPMCRPTFASVIPLLSQAVDSLPSTQKSSLATSRSSFLPTQTRIGASRQSVDLNAPASVVNVDSSRNLLSPTSSASSSFDRNSNIRKMFRKTITDVSVVRAFPRSNSPRCTSGEMNNVNNKTGEGECMYSIPPDAPFGSIRPLEAHPIVTLSRKFSVDSAVQVILSCPTGEVWITCDDGIIHVFDKIGKKVTSFYAHSKPILGMTAVEKTIWSISEDGYLHIWDINNYRIMKKKHGHKEPVKCILPVHQPPRIQVWTAALSEIAVWSKQCGLKLRKKVSQVVAAMAQYEDVVYCAAHTSIIAFSAVTLDYLMSWEAHSSRVNTIVIASHTLWTGSSDKTIKVWNSKTGEHIKTLEGHSSKVTALLFTGEHVWSGSWDKSILIWDHQLKECVQELSNEHKDSIRAISWVQKDVVWSGGSALDMNICCWTYNPWIARKAVSAPALGSTVVLD
eukprot:TRINITY_DN5267_c0_g2_i1.p1 TRINITY_DN5267_c0_g2~~TRINITY_DN5267_c0_g2_i1.p1  ORF type:complete len:1706 (+),score=349.49 TRINITY_DN5267_c0_g2_i1:81-5198(+)